MVFLGNGVVEGFHWVPGYGFDARPRVTFETGEEVEYAGRIRMMDLSVARCAHEARTLISVWFQQRALIISVASAQFSIYKGVEEEFEISKMLMAEEEA